MKVIKKGMDTYIRFRLPKELLENFDKACEPKALQKSAILRKLLEAWLTAGAPSPPVSVLSTENLSNISIRLYDLEEKEAKQRQKKQQQ